MEATVIPAAHVRIQEMFTSIDIIEQAAKKIPEGPIEVKFTGAPDGGVLLADPNNPGVK